MANLFPVHIDLDGKRAVVVGGGRVAQRKVRLLVEAGADVVVVSPEICEGITSLQAVQLRRRSFKPEDLDGSAIVIAATDESEVNRSVLEAAHSRGLLVNVVDQPEMCDFYVPASVRRGRLCVAVSTGGASPSLARRLRRKLEEDFSDAYAGFLDLLAEMRPVVLETISDPDARRELFAEISSEEVLRELVDSGPEAARQCMRGALTRKLGEIEEAS